MQLKKAIKSSSKINTIDPQIFFHLGEQQSQIALNAKIELQALSKQQTFTQYIDSHFAGHEKAPHKGTRSFTQTATTTLQQFEKGTQFHKKMGINQKAKQNKKSFRPNFKKSKYIEGNKLPFRINQLNFPSCKADTDDIENGNRYLNVQLCTDNFFDAAFITSRSFAKREHKLSLHATRNNTSLQNKKSYENRLHFDSTPLHYNNGRKFVKCQQRWQKQRSLSEEHYGRPKTTRSSRQVTLRPQFLKLISKIKQKQEQIKRKKAFLIKGRKTNI